MNDHKLTNQDILNFLDHYKKNVECLSQFACSEDFHKVEQLADELLVYLKIAINYQRKKVHHGYYLVWPDDSVIHQSDYCEITHSYKGDDFHIVKYSELTPSQIWEV